MDELAVVGLDLTTGLEVSIVDEAEVPRWRRKGHVGDRSLVCLHCLDGTDGPPRRVALVAKGRIAGRRRAHFAHPPGEGPPGGMHRPESVWHAAGKQALATWARRHPAVKSARVEAWTRDGRRRSDVRIHLHPTGRRSEHLASDAAAPRRRPGPDGLFGVDDLAGPAVVLELQSAWITDDEWRQRHQDYRRLGMVDVWLWHHRVGVPGIIAAYHQPGWLYGDDRAELTAVVGRGRPRTGRWWEERDPAVYGTHWPAGPGERATLLPIPLDKIQLSAAGLSPPEERRIAWATETRTAARAAADRTARDEAVAAHPAGLGRGSRRRLTPALPCANQAPPHVPGPVSGQVPAPRAPEQTLEAPVRVDGWAPDCDPSRRRYLCNPCSRILTIDQLDTHQHHH
ncbi:hypothetical protein [Actinomycetospora sp. NBRC 106375]|uniref:hypothetical protein n=1 Tax=Actinomycetospora sp. NBRC 106375 TaxID=3032207 RepID=UPI002556559F|nr:hypothetical protein [Actinomycetospora sp. NBRC 106375]